MSNNAGRSAKSIRNVTIGLASKIIILLLAFISRKLFISVLGNEYLGINSLFTDVLTMLNMAELGFGVAMSYSFYKPLAEKDEDKLAALVNFFGKVYKIIALAVATIGICLIPFLEVLIRTENTIPHLRLYYILYLTNTVCIYFCVYKSSIINAD
nr:hypothetical protein [Lachnospiraceae bacterium]